ncbi:MAG TPA: hypothetical protein PK659_10255, partial [Methanothrix sp.]
NATGVLTISAASGTPRYNGQKQNARGVFRQLPVEEDITEDAAEILLSVMDDIMQILRESGYFRA